MARTHERPQRVWDGVVRNSVREIGVHGGSWLAPDKAQRPLAGDVESRVGSIWNEAGFNSTSRPSVIGRIGAELSFEFPDSTFHVADVPLKIAGQHKFAVPKEIAALTDFLQTCVNYEAAINPEWPSYFAFLTAHRALVAEGGLMRIGGAHSDSIQGPRIVPKRPIEHAYLACDSTPPRFFEHCFDLGNLRSDTDDLGPTISALADTARSFVPAEDEIVLFDAYCIHEAQPAFRAGVRTFIRLTMSTREFDREGNTLNRMIDCPWVNRARPLPPFG